VRRTAPAADPTGPRCRGRGRKPCPPRGWPPGPPRRTTPGSGASSRYWRGSRAFSSGWTSRILLSEQGEEGLGDADEVRAGGRAGGSGPLI